MLSLMILSSTKIHLTVPMPFLIHPQKCDFSSSVIVLVLFIWPTVMSWIVVYVLMTLPQFSPPLLWQMVWKHSSLISGHKAHAPSPSWEV